MAWYVDIWANIVDPANHADAIEALKFRAQNTWQRSMIWPPKLIGIYMKNDRRGEFLVGLLSHSRNPGGLVVGMGLLTVIGMQPETLIL